MERKKPLTKRLYTLKEAAVYLGRKESGMRILMWNGQIPVVRGDGSRKCYFDIHDMDKFIEDNKHRDEFSLWMYNNSRTGRLLRK